MARHVTQVLASIGDQFAGVGQFDWIFEPLVPAFGQRFRALFHLILMRLRRFNTVQRTLCRLGSHLHNIVKTVTGIGDRFRGFRNRLIQSQLTQAVAQHARQATDPGNYVTG